MDATFQDLETEIVDLLRRECGIRAPVDRDTRLVEDLGLDSGGFLTLALAVENRFRLVLEEDPERPPATLGELVDLVQARLASP